MSLRVSLVTIFVVGALLQRSDLSAAQSPPIKFYGLYSESCRMWTAELPRRASVQVQGQTWWVLGFVSGASAILSTERDITMASSDIEGITTWITKYCSDHPIESIPTAAMKLVGELRRAER
jgi:hypothetical protein